MKKIQALKKALLTSCKQEFKLVPGSDALWNRTPRPPVFAFGLPRGQEVPVAGTLVPVTNLQYLYNNKCLVFFSFTQYFRVSCSSQDLQTALLPDLKWIIMN